MSSRTLNHLDSNSVQQAANVIDAQRLSPPLSSSSFQRVATTYTVLLNSKCILPKFTSTVISDLHTSFGDVVVIDSYPWRPSATPRHSSLFADGRCDAVHEVLQLLPCKTSILCEHNPQVSSSKQSTALLTLSSLRLNVKLGGVNSAPEPRDISFLTDSANPTMVMGECSPAP